MYQVEEKMNWVDDLLTEMEWTLSDLSRASGVDTGTLSNLRNGKRKLGLRIAEKLARATRRKPEDLLRAAGEIGGNPPKDDKLYRIENLYHTLREEGNKQRALEFMEFLSSQEDKNDRKGKKSK